MSKIYHIRAKEDYAATLIELLKKEGAVEDLELKEYELSESQKSEIDKELYLMENDPQYLLKWDEVKHRFKKP